MGGVCRSEPAPGDGMVALSVNMFHVICAFSLSLVTIIHKQRVVVWPKIPKPNFLDKTLHMNSNCGSLSFN